MEAYQDGFNQSQHPTPPPQQIQQDAKNPPDISTLTQHEKWGLEDLIDGTLPNVILEQMITRYFPDHKTYLTPKSIKAAHQFFCEAQGAKTPFESLLIQHILISHHRYLLLQLELDKPPYQEQYHNMALREQNNMRRLMLTYQQLNACKNITVINANQANIANGPQQINNDIGS